MKKTGKICDDGSWMWYMLLEPETEPGERKEFDIVVCEMWLPGNWKGTSPTMQDLHETNRLKIGTEIDDINVLSAILLKGMLEQGPLSESKQLLFLSIVAYSAKQHANHSLVSAVLRKARGPREEDWVPCQFWFDCEEADVAETKTMPQALIFFGMGTLIQSQRFKTYNYTT
jgi:hypothetical protein